MTLVSLVYNATIQHARLDLPRSLTVLWKLLDKCALQALCQGVCKSSAEMRLRIVIV